MLDKFRETAITWDKANRKVYEPLRASAGDNKGRKLSVQIVNDGVIENLSGASLSLFWETKDKAHNGLDAFKTVDATKGEFEIYYTTGMLSNEGTLNANLVLVDASGRIVSEPFTITVFKGIDDDAIQSSDSFTALTEALAQVATINNKADRDELLALESTFEQNKVSVERQLQQIPAKAEARLFERKKITKLNPTIVGYGDSNTRYYEGDRGVNGSITHAYTSWLERFVTEYPDMFGSKIINAGYSGQTLGYGLTNYAENVTAHNADVVVIGFGTNNIKDSTNTLESYITNMNTMINRLLGDDIVPIILGIPWFSEDYAGVTMQARLEPWNVALRDLCLEKNVEFIDVYNMLTSENSDLWFNERTTPKRHYSQFAEKVLAEEIFKIIIKLSSFAPKKADFIQDKFNYRSLDWLNEYGTLGFESYNLGLDAMDTVKIPAGSSIKLRLYGRYSVSFYPRANATARFSDETGDVVITNTLNDGVYYPIKRAYSTRVSPLPIPIVTITAVGGDLFIRKIAMEHPPYTPERFVAPILREYPAASLPQKPPVGYTVFCKELLKEVVYGRANVDTWTDQSGYVCVGTSAQRTQVQPHAPVGFKFYDVTLGKPQRWNGTSWSDF